MRPSPLELRQRLVEAVDEQRGTIEEIASFFQVHSSYIYKLLRQRRERHDLTPRPHGGGASAKLEAEDRRVLAELVATQPDATLAELRQGVKKKKHVHVRLSTIWRWLAELVLTRKKGSAGPGSGPG
jgi:transposase